MAGHYFYDPRPFYGHNSHTGLMPLDELFYGRYEPVPYWMDQRMTAFEDNYYPGHKQMVSRRGPEVMQQQYIPQRGENNFMAYKRPELVRDDMYTDMYRRSPYNFNYNYGRDGVAVAPMHPEIMRQQQPLRGQTQDDTWVHAMSAPTLHGHGQGYRGLPEPPPGGMATQTFSNGNGNGNEQYRPINQGGDQYRQMDIPVNSHMMSNQSSMMSTQSNMMGNPSNMMGNPSNMTSNPSNMMSNPSNMMSNPSNMNNRDSNGNSHGSNHGNSHGTHGIKQMGVSGNQNGSFGKSLGKSGTMQTKQTSSNNAKRYDSSSSSDSEDDDDYQHGHNNGAKWATVKSQHGHSGKATSTPGHKVANGSHGYESNSRGVKNSSQSLSSKKSTSHSHGSYGGTTKHGSQSTISKLLRFQDDSSSSEDESYGHGHGKKGSSKGSSKGSVHQHGSHVASFQPNYGSQPKQMQFSSQSKSVELKVPICCDNCERKVRKCLEKMHGVESVLCDQWNRKVIVYGNLKADDVLKRVRRVKKTSELWQLAKQQQQQQQQLMRLY